MPLPRSLTLAAALAALTAPAGHAIVANPEPCTVVQPDGTEVTLQLYGDESYSYTLTADGYGVVYNPASRAWEYAVATADGLLAPSGQAAANGERPRADVAPGLRPPRPAAALLAPVSAGLNPGVPALAAAAGYDYSRFRGLVLLVEYNDKAFSRTDIRDVLDAMINQADYDGYMTTAMLPTKEPCTGSVRDYYYDNSGGRFDPTFDVVGPVQIDYSQHYARKSSGAQVLVSAALKAADEQIDYTLYDTDGNRTVDMVYLIFAGAGSNYSGNAETLLWPHASTVMSLSLDGVSFGRYACSTELYGSEVSTTLDGIGTMCHEFSHVLGLPDLYDTDYATSGQSVHPQKWSIMASGSYLNKSRTPAGYSLYERYALGFATPTRIDAPGAYSLAPLNQGGAAPQGYRIDSPVDGEFFLLECRQKTRWDEYLPGEGMLVHRVDSTNASAWENNKVNASSAHNYYTLLRATPKTSSASSATVTDSDGDPFPGSGGVTRLDNTTTPSMRSWTMLSSKLIIDNIARNDADATVSFTVAADATPTLAEDFLEMAPTDGDASGVEGRFTTWTFASGALIESDDASGESALTTLKGAEVTCGPVVPEIDNIEVSIANPTGSSAIFRMYHSTDGGASWKAMTTLEGTANPSVKAGEQAQIRYGTGTLANAHFRLTQYTGSATDRCRVQRMLFGVNPSYEFSAITDVGADPAAADPAASPCYYDLTGRPAGPAPTRPGIYLRRQGSRAEKLLVK